MKQTEEQAMSGVIDSERDAPSTFCRETPQPRYREAITSTVNPFKYPVSGIEIKMG